MKKLIIIAILLWTSWAWGATGDILAVRISSDTSVTDTVSKDGNASTSKTVESADGMVAEIDIDSTGGHPVAGGTFDFGLGTNNSCTGAKILFTVTSMGYGSSGNPTTATRTLCATRELRRVAPNNTSANTTVVGSTTTVRVALSDFVYAKDKAGVGNSGTDPTVVIGSGFYTEGGQGNNAHASMAVTNNAVLAYPQSPAAKGKPDYEVVGNSYTMETVTVNRFPQQGNPLARVEYTCTDEHGSPAATANATRMTVSNYGPDQHAVLTYSGTLDFSGLTDYDAITCHTKIYPHVGDSGSVRDTSTEGISMPDARFTATILFKNATGKYKGGFAIVDPVNGQNSTAINCDGSNPCVFNTQAAAEAAASSRRYLYIGQAIQAIKTFNNIAEATWTTHNDPGNGTVLLVEGTHNGSTSAPGSSQGAQKTWLTIQPVSTANKNLVIYQPGTNNTNLKVTMLKFSGLSITTTIIGGIMGSTTTDALWIDRCNINMSGAASIYSFAVAYATYDYITQLNGGFSYYSSTKTPWALIRGNYSTVTDGTPAVVYSILGNNGISPDRWMDQNNTPGMPISDGAIYAFNTLYKKTTLFTQPPGKPSAGAGVGLTTSIGIAFVQNVIEAQGSSFTLCQFYNDGTDRASNNVIIWHNTFIGNRCNWGYNDGLSAAANPKTFNVKHTNWSMIGNNIDIANTKDDTHNAAYSKSITSISSATPNGTVTVTSHGLSTGDVIYVSGVSGAMGTLLNGSYQTITNTGANTFTIQDTSSAAACAASCGTVDGRNYNRTGGWAVGYHVGAYGNLTRSTSTGGTWDFSWQGEFDGVDSIFGTAPTYIIDQSYDTGGNNGYGYYNIPSTFPALGLIPTGKAALPYDLDGRPRLEPDNPGAYRYYGVYIKVQ